MLPCYAFDNESRDATAAKGVADIYVCLREAYDALLETHKDRLGDALGLPKELPENSARASPANGMSDSSQTGKLIAVSLAGEKVAYLWTLASLHDLWAWAELPARLLGLAEQEVFRLIEPREEKARECAILGWGLASYAFEKFRSGAGSRPLRLLLDVGEREVARRAEIICQGRDLINTPANVLGAERLEQVVREFAEDSGGVMYAIRGEELLRENYPLIYAVGKSAREAPRLLDIRWQSKNDPAKKQRTKKQSTKTLTIVGKGVCFDSGGLNLKDARSMLLMKKDMGGAAHAICLARMLLASACPISLRLLLPIAENAVSRDAMRPMDIYPSRKGDSVEIGHTDAEGRLLLADALWEASTPQQNKQGGKKAEEPDSVPDLVIDFATLTGAAKVATGPLLPNLFTNDDSLATKAALCAHETQDPLWRMPLWQEYRSVLNARHADITNASSWPYAGAITAALFLQNFVAKGILWIHMDVMAWNEKTRAGRPEGGEIQGVRALAALVERWSRE